MTAPTILIVDDVAENIEVLAGFLCKNYDVSYALNGPDALAQASNSPPDLILLDVMMPGMSGLEVMAHLKKNPATSDVPVILVTAKNDTQSESHALHAGAVDFIHKPINPDVVQARVALHLRLRSQARDLQEKSQSLQAYYEQQEAENILARDVIFRQMRLKTAPISEDTYWFNPATTFSGDVFNVTKTKDGRIFALVADATGHGLTAAITTLPLLATYHDQIERGSSLRQILASVNRALCTNLPIGRFVAAAFVSLDPVTRMVEVWNGGMPEILLLGQEGNIVRRIPSSDLALGVAHQEEGEFRREAFRLENGQQLIMFSDGAIEACNPQGEEFKQTRLEAILREHPAAQRVGQVRQALSRHLESACGQDDITLLALGCEHCDG